MPAPKVAISCHPRPHGHPHLTIPAEFDLRGMRDVYQTDEHYHLIFENDGVALTVQYTH
ncbi:MAG: hypothetical protein ACYC3X_02525 [Pirellulaceae bacterium]